MFRCSLGRLLLVGSRIGCWWMLLKCLIWNSMFKLWLLVLLLLVVGGLGWLLGLCCVGWKLGVFCISFIVLVEKLFVIRLGMFLVVVLIQVIRLLVWCWWVGVLFGFGCSCVIQMLISVLFSFSCIMLVVLKVLGGCSRVMLFLFIGSWVSMVLLWCSGWLGGLVVMKLQLQCSWLVSQQVGLWFCCCSICCIEIMFGCRLVSS